MDAASVREGRSGEVTGFFVDGLSHKDDIIFIVVVVVIIIIIRSSSSCCSGIFFGGEGHHKVGYIGNAKR